MTTSDYVDCFSLQKENQKEKERKIRSKRKKKYK